MPLVSLILATFLKAELGFLGVVVKTFKQTPLLKGEEKPLGLFFKALKPKARAGVLSFPLPFFLPFLINC